MCVHRNAAREHGIFNSNNNIAREWHFLIRLRKLTSQAYYSLKRGVMIYKAATWHIHAYCSEKDMYHFSQKSLQRVGGSE